MKSTRPPFTTRTMRLTSADVRDRAVAMLRNVPIDPDKPLELIVHEYKGKRKDEQNSVYWCLLKDIASQAWFEGRQYSADMLHIYCKRQFLPDDEEGCDPEHVRKDYQKWDYDPSGDRVLIGSTTQLTVKGFSEYLTAVECFGASLGVLFTTKREA